MKKKLRQITDAVHGTIYLSNWEAELISTPYFYRLHDIYQSSTVYLTYPCNRTKRYEHSLGVMHLASELLQACLANSQSQVQIDIFENLKKRIEDIISTIVSNGLDLLNDYGATDQIKNILNRPENKDLSSLFNKLNLPNEEDSEYNDQSFGYYKYIPKQEGKYYIFMYHILLQAIRIVALYHDVGHPPYSHIVEDVLKNVNSNLKELQKDINKAKEKERLKKELSELGGIYKEYSKLEKKLIIGKGEFPKDFHEQVSVKILILSLKDVIRKKLKKYTKTIRKEEVIEVYYYLLVAKLTECIFLNADNFFKSLHSIIDGIIDVDRMDYIMRDTINSGVDWGRIPYTRIIKSAIWAKPPDNICKNTKNDKFIIAFPRKTIEDIEDLLILRYKISSRINFHHRCVRTGMALQEAVWKLIKLYFKGFDITGGDIRIFWEAIKIGTNGLENKIIRWNDSWLISTLHKAYVKICELEQNEESNEIKDIVDNMRLRDDLQEILLSQKSYMSLFKHQVDVRKFISDILDKDFVENEIIHLGHETFRKLRDLIEHLQRHEREIINNPSKSADDRKKAKDGLNKLDDRCFMDLKQLLVTYELFQGCSKADPNYEHWVQDKLGEYLKISNNDHERLIIKINRKIENYGIEESPRTDEYLDSVYLYDDNKKPEAYEARKFIIPRLKAIAANACWMYIFYKFTPQSNSIGIDLEEKIENDNDIEEKLKQIRGRIIEYFKSKLREKLLEQYPHLNKSSL